MRRRPGPLAASVAVVLCTGLFLFRRALFLDEGFVERDLAVYYRAARSLVAPLALGSGGVPQWNPYFASGQPFAANPVHGVFHPLTWLFFLLPFEWALRLQVVLPPFVAAFSMFTLLRALGRTRHAAGFGALVWGFGGYTLSTTNGLNYLFASSVLPLVLGLAARVAAGGGRRLVAALAFATGLEVLAGEPVSLLLTPPLLAVALVHACGGRIPFALAARRAAPGLLLGLALGAATLLPALRLAADSSRAHGIPAAKADLWSLPPVRLLELLAPFLMGHPGIDGGGYWGTALYPDRHTPFLYSIYPGLLATLLALTAGLAALARARRPGSRALLLWSATALAGALLACGSHLPFWPLLRSAPPFSAVRYPEKLFLLTALSLVVLAAAGFDALAHGHARLRRRLFWTLGGLAVVAAASATAGGFATGVGAPRSTSARDALWLALVALGYAVALAALPRVPGRGQRTLVLLALTACDLVPAVRGLLTTRSVAALRTPPPVVRDVMPAARAGPVFHAAAWQLTRGDWAAALPPQPVFWGVPLTLEPDYDLSELGWSAAATQQVLGVLRSDPRAGVALLRRRGVVAVLRLDERAPRNVAPRVETQLLPDTQPFAFLAARAQAVEGDAQWREAVSSLGPAAARTVLLQPGDAAGLPAAPSTGRVEVRSRAPGRIVLDVEVDGPAEGLLAVNQTWDRYWSARSDGPALTLLRADSSLSALRLPPGRHTVELRYDDPWIRGGVAVSSLSLILILGLISSRPDAHEPRRAPGGPRAPGGSLRAPDVPASRGGPGGPGRTVRDGQGGHVLRAAPPAPVLDPRGGPGPRDLHPVPEGRGERKPRPRGLA